jgi:tRNA pseudouridine(55) synthase
VLNKKEGETPLATLEKFRTRNKKYSSTKLTYAGRLDPMASGLLLVLAGPEVKNKEKYLKLGKTYEFSVLFGFSTDTYDILGKVQQKQIYLGSKKDLATLIQNNLKYFKGSFVQKYPVFSSKTVAGKQLFQYAREGVEVEIPEKEVQVKKLKFLELKKISGQKLNSLIESRIEKVSGDFRQKKIIQIWRKNLRNKKATQFFLASFEIECGSGVYVRGIADELGKKIGLPALAFSIKRTQIGKWVEAE